MKSVTWKQNSIIAFLASISLYYFKFALHTFTLHSNPIQKLILNVNLIPRERERERERVGSVEGERGDGVRAEYHLSSLYEWFIVCLLHV